MFMMFIILHHKYRGKKLDQQTKEQKMAVLLMDSRIEESHSIGMHFTSFRVYFCFFYIYQYRLTIIRRASYLYQMIVL
jgi:hypothetical protein